MKWAYVRYDIDESLGKVPISFIENSTIKEVRIPNDMFFEGVILTLLLKVY